MAAAGSRWLPPPEVRLLYGLCLRAIVNIYIGHFLYSCKYVPSYYIYADVAVFS